MVTLDDYSLDEPSRELYADEIDANGVVNREFYYTKGRYFLTRQVQIMKLDGLLQKSGFKNEHHIPLGHLIEGIICGVNVDAPHYKKYFNEENTRVTIKPNYSGWGNGNFYTGLFIEVGKTGSFVDYIKTCNLFREYFGLEKRVMDEGEKK